MSNTSSQHFGYLDKKSSFTFLSTRFKSKFVFSLYNFHAELLKKEFFNSKILLRISFPYMTETSSSLMDGILYFFLPE